MKKNSFTRKRYIWGVVFFLVIAVGAGIMIFREAEAESDDGAITIGFCADNLVIERWQRDQEIFQAKAKKRA